MTLKRRAEISADIFARLLRYFFLSCKNLTIIDWIHRLFILLLLIGVELLLSLAVADFVLECFGLFSAVKFTIRSSFVIIVGYTFSCVKSRCQNYFVILLKVTHSSMFAT